MKVSALFDTHAHLNDPRFDADRADILRLCENHGISRIMEIADSPADWDKAIDLSRAHPQAIRCSLGLHPYYADQWNDELTGRLLDRCKLQNVSAVGEIGLDYGAKCQIPKEFQISSFNRMLDVADQCRLPIVIHCREAYMDMMPILRRRFQDNPEKRFRGVLHCFSGSKEDALEAMRLGFALGVDGPITYPKNDALRDALKAAGLDYLVLETDSPYLPPQSCRGQRNDPSKLREIAQKVADVFGQPLEKALEILWQNSLDLFRI